MKTTALLLLSAIGTLAQETVGFAVYSDPDCTIPLREGADPNAASNSLTVAECHVLSYTSPLDGHLQTNSYSNFHCEANAVTWTHTPGNADCTGSKVIIDKLYSDRCTAVATHMGLTYQKLIGYDTPCTATYEYPADTVYSGEEYSDLAVADLSGNPFGSPDADKSQGGKKGGMKGKSQSGKKGGMKGKSQSGKTKGFRVQDGDKDKDKKGSNPFGGVVEKGGMKDKSQGDKKGGMKDKSQGDKKGGMKGKSQGGKTKGFRVQDGDKDKKGKDKKGSGGNPFGGVVARMDYDAPTDAPTDASTDAPTDASTDAPTDAPTDGPVNIALPTRPAAPVARAPAAGSTRVPAGVPPAGTRLDSSFLQNRNRPVWGAPASAYGFGSFGSYLPYGNVARTWGTSYTAPVTTAATTETTATTATVANTGFGFGGYGNYGGFGGYGNYGGFGGFGGFGNYGRGFGGYWGR